MKHKLTMSLFIVFIGFMMVIPTGNADPLVAGDFIKFIDRAGSPGGEFGIKEWLGGGNYTNELFVTFCLEKNEYIDFSHNFEVVGITDRAIYGGQPTGGDQIDPKTAWLYTQFRNHTLSGYTGDVASANELQEAIWYIEGEIVSINGKAKDWYDLAVAAGWKDIGNVRVLNLEWTVSASGFKPGDRAQDQLVLVPEPGTLLLLGAGLLGIVVTIRRRRK